MALPLVLFAIGCGSGVNARPSDDAARAQGDVDAELPADRAVYGPDVPSASPDVFGAPDVGPDASADRAPDLMPHDAAGPRDAATDTPPDQRTAVDLAPFPDAPELDARPAADSGPDHSPADAAPRTLSYKIDDFDDCDSAAIKADGRSGDWVSAKDNRQATTTISPLPFAPAIGSASGSGGCSAHLSGMIAKNSWALFVLNLHATGYDASPYGGLSFWARGTGTLNVVIPTRATQDVIYGGTCGSNCSSHFTSVPLSSEWKRYEVPWSQLSLPAQANQVPFDPSKILAVEFHEWSTGASLLTYDLWLDDISFLPR